MKAMNLLDYESKAMVCTVSNDVLKSVSAKLTTTLETITISTTSDRRNLRVVDDTV